MTVQPAKKPSRRSSIQQQPKEEDNIIGAKSGNSVQSVAAEKLPKENENTFGAISKDADKLLTGGISTQSIVSGAGGNRAQSIGAAGGNRVHRKTRTIQET